MKITKGSERLDGARQIMPIILDVTENEFDLLKLGIKKLTTESEDDVRWDMLIVMRNFEHENRPHELPF